MEIPSVNPNKSPKQVHEQVSRIAGSLIDRAAELTDEVPGVNEHEQITSHKIVVESPSDPAVVVQVSSGKNHAIGGDSVFTSKDGQPKYVGKTSSVYGENIFVGHKADQAGSLEESYTVLEQKPRMIGPKKHSQSGVGLEGDAEKGLGSVAETLGGIRSDISEAKLAQKAKSK